MRELISGGVPLPHTPAVPPAARAPKRPAAPRSPPALHKMLPETVRSHLKIIKVRLYAPHSPANAPKNAFLHLKVKLGCSMQVPIVGLLCRL